MIIEIFIAICWGLCWAVMAHLHDRHYCFNETVCARQLNHTAFELEVNGHTEITGPVAIGESLNSCPAMTVWAIGATDKWSFDYCEENMLIRCECEKVSNDEIFPWVSCKHVGFPRDCKMGCEPRRSSWGDGFCVAPTDACVPPIIRLGCADYQMTDDQRAVCRLAEGQIGVCGAFRYSVFMLPSNTDYANLGSLAIHHTTQTATKLADDLGLTQDLRASGEFHDVVRALAELECHYRFPMCVIRSGYRYLGSKVSTCATDCRRLMGKMEALALRCGTAPNCDWIRGYFSCEPGAPNRICESGASNLRASLWVIVVVLLTVL